MIDCPGRHPVTIPATPTLVSRRSSLHSQLQRLRTLGPFSNRATHARRPAFFPLRLSAHTTPDEKIPSNLASYAVPARHLAARKASDTQHASWFATRITFSSSLVPCSFLSAWATAKESPSISMAKVSCYSPTPLCLPLYSVIITPWPFLPPSAVPSSPANARVPPPMLVARRPSAHNAASTPGTAVPPRNRHEPCLTCEANQRLVVNLNHFRLLRVVGRGAFGKVRIVERKDTNLSFALKYIRKDEGKRTTQFWHLSTCCTTRPMPRTLYSAGLKPARAY